MTAFLCLSSNLPLGVRHCSSLKIHTASPVAWITSALDNTFWANAWRQTDISFFLKTHTTVTVEKNRRRLHIFPHLHRVLSFIGLARWDVEPDLHEGNLSVVVLVKLQSDLVLSSGALGHVGQWDLERCVVVYIER